MLASNLHGDRMAMAKTSQQEHRDLTEQSGKLPVGSDKTVRDLYGREFALPRLIVSSPQLQKRFANLYLLGASSFNTLFDRQNAGSVGPRIVLGPPARREFSEVADQRVPVINLATSGYLDLGSDPRVRDAALAAIEQFGTHTGGCRLLSGTTKIHFELEEQLAQFVCAPSVVTYSSGYATNLSVISALFGPGDLIFLDRQAHRSLYDGALLSRAAIKRFAHNDLDYLDGLLRKTASVARRLVAVDAVYSMEGDIVPLPALIELTKRHGVFLLVDEAHALGVLGKTGRGIAEHFNIPTELIDIRIGTLSKAMAAAGGFAAVDQSIGALLRYTSHGRVFSAAMTPPDAAAALAAVKIMGEEPFRVARLRSNAEYFRSALKGHGLNVLGDGTAIVPVPVGERMTTLEAGLRLLTKGFFLNPVVAPGVPAGGERLRCMVSASHQAPDLASAAHAIADVLDGLHLRT
jgi:glycine C-acetyltransferase